MKTDFLLDRLSDRGIRLRCFIYGLGLTVLAGTALLPTAAEAQSVWAGVGSGSSLTSDYKTGANWSTNPTAPIAGGSSAEFGSFGSTLVIVTAGAITPDSWQFDASAQAYTVTGAAVNFNTGTGLVNNAVGPISIANSLGGANAQLQQLGTGTLTLSGINTYTGVTTISAGTLALTGTGSIAASSQVNLTNGLATFDISGTTAGALITSLVGASGSHVNLGAQTLTITAASSGDIFAGTIGGSGGLTVISGSSVSLSGTNTYTGVTTINHGGDLLLSSENAVAHSSKVIDNGVLDLSVTPSQTSITSLAGTDPTAKVFLSSNNALTLSAANDTFAGVISGNGGLVVVSGDEKLTGANTYTGVTTILSGGVLAVNGSLSGQSPINVLTGGALTGTGTVGSTVISSGGEFAPGLVTPGSFMTVGTLAFQPGAVYEIGLNPTTSSFAVVAGKATLGGATVQAIYGFGSYVAKQYTILTAGIISGTFGGLVNTNLPANFKSTLAYDATHAYLDLALNFTTPTSPSIPGAATSGGLNGNQQNVANALSNFFNTSGGIPLAFGALTPAGLTQVSGETATGSQQTTFDAMNQFMGVMTDPFVAGRGDGFGGSSGAPIGYAATPTSGAARDANAMFVKSPIPFEARWSTWVAGYGGSQTTDGNATVGSNNTTSSIAGTAVGADYRISPDTLAGFALAGGGTSFGVTGSGSGHSDLFQAGAFIRHTNGPAYISAALAYGWQDITTNRTVTAAGLDQLQARFNANAWSGRVEGGYRFVAPVINGGIGITPYAAAQFTTLDLPAYAEHALVGASNFALAYGSQSASDVRSELGIRTDKSYAMQDAILTLRGRLAWAHDYDPNRSIAATFQTLPGASFVVNGAAQASDSALTTASVEMKWINGWSAAATFEGEFSDVTRSYAGKGVVRYAW